MTVGQTELGVLPTSIFEGIRVVEASTVIAAPLSAAILGDFGADVIKIEDPRGGDPIRRLGPTFEGEATSSKVTNRNKRSVTINLGTERGRELYIELVKTADVVVTNFRVPTLRRWRIDYDDLRAVRPELVMMHLTGYGRSGPYQARPGFARVAEAFAGLTYMSGHADGPPLFAGYAVGDGLAGVYGAFSLSAALLHRERTGEGQLIDLALYEPMLRIIESLIVDYDLLGIVPGRTGNQNPAVAPSSIYRTSDDRWITIPASTQQMWERLCRALDVPDLMDDPRYCDNRSRISHRDALDRRIDELVAKRSFAELEHAFGSHDVAYGSVNSVVDIVNDPHIIERRNLVRVGGKGETGVLMQAPVPRFSSTPGSIRSVGPEAGDHTDEVLSDICGLDAEALTRLRSEGVI